MIFLGKKNLNGISISMNKKTKIKKLTEKEFDALTTVLLNGVYMEVLEDKRSQRAFERAERKLYENYRNTIHS